MKHFHKHNKIFSSHSRKGRSAYPGFMPLHSMLAKTPARWLGMRHGALLCSLAALLSTPALAQEHSHHAHHAHHGAAHTHKALAPIGVMGDHMHETGDWMISARSMRMNMEDMRDGTSDLSPEDIVSNAALYPNPNAGPAGFRVIPTEMRMDMHMFGVMYGATDWLTLMAMGSYQEKVMDHVTFQGMAGTTRLGTFTTRSRGWGDVKLGGLIRLYDEGAHHLHANLGLSLPTGSIKEKDDVLTPANARPTLRLPYAMQLGSGTYDALPGLTYTGAHNAWSWGGQYKAVIRLEDENDQGYRLGNQHTLSAWGGYQINPWLQTSLRADYDHSGDIKGSDALITAPVTTADPDHYGGDVLELGLGANITPTGAAWQGHQIGIEARAPVYQDLNGPQMKRDYTITGGWVYRF
jgi:hypothetical protein